MRVLPAFVFAVLLLGGGVSLEPASCCHMQQLQQENADCCHQQTVTHGCQHGSTSGCHCVRPSPAPALMHQQQEMPKGDSTVFVQPFSPVLLPASTDTAALSLAQDAQAPPEQMLPFYYRYQMLLI